MNYQRVTILGNVTADAELKTSKDGTVDYATFRVAVSSNKKEKSIYFPITLFGERSKKLARYITKGLQILVAGRIEVSDNGYFSVVADEIEFGSSAKREATEAAITDATEDAF